MVKYQGWSLTICANFILLFSQNLLVNFTLLFSQHLLVSCILLLLILVLWNYELLIVKKKQYALFLYKGPKMRTQKVDWNYYPFEIGFYDPLYISGLLCVWKLVKIFARVCLEPKYVQSFSMVWAQFWKNKGCWAWSMRWVGLIFWRTKGLWACSKLRFFWDDECDMELLQFGLI